MKIKEAFDFCMDQANIERAASTARAYRISLRVFETFLRENNIDVNNDDIARLPIDLFIRFPSWLVAHYTRLSAAVYMAGVMYAWNWMLIQDWVQPNLNQSARLTKAIEMARFNREKRGFRTPGDGHADKMIEAVKLLDEPEPLKERDVALVLFLASSGCRNSEAIKLTVKDIDLSLRQAYIIASKNEKDRLAFFSKDAANAIRSYWTARGWASANDPVFSRHDKGAGKKHSFITTATVRNVVDLVSAMAGIEKGHFTPHYFRHAFAIRALDESGNLALVQDLLGHASANTTRIYAEISDKNLREAHHRIFN